MVALTHIIILIIIIIRETRLTRRTADNIHFALGAELRPAVDQQRLDFHVALLRHQVQRRAAELQRRAPGAAAAVVRALPGPPAVRAHF